MNYLVKLIICISLLNFLSANDIKKEYGSIADQIINSLDTDTFLSSPKKSIKSFKV